MKKKTNMLGFLLCISTMSLQAQMFYYFQGQKIELTVARNLVNVIIDENVARSSDVNQLFQQFGMEQDEINPIRGMMRLDFGLRLNEQEYSELVASLKQNEAIKHVFPFFERPGADPIGTSSIFYIQLKEVQDTVLLRKVAERQGVQIVRQIPYMPLWYILSLRGSGFSNSIEATNYFFETGLFAEIDPAFMFNFRPNCTNDPMFSQQWGLRQTTSETSVGINACKAWTITRGAGIKVAVVDQGIDPNQLDLKPNFHELSFNTQPDIDPFIHGFDHGTHVAGIIAAVKNNDLQIAGVAPKSKIMKVSHALNVHSYVSAELASGISWAWQHGADIINNSWGDWGGSFYNDLRSAVLERAILDALTYGRDDLGSIVVFASGNTGLSDRIDYPGSFHPEILIVGAIDMDGTRASFSNHGTDLDIVAPGVNILSLTDKADCILTGVYNGTVFRPGTSQAAPHVSGVAALILSVNPNLTGQEVRDIIMSTAQRIRPELHMYQYLGARENNGSWSFQVGHGLVDAYAAVRAALATLPPAIIGSDNIRNSTEAYEIANLPAGATVSWTVSNNISVVSVCAEQNSISVRANITSGCSTGTITATITPPGSSPVVITRNVMVGFPPHAGSIRTRNRGTRQPWNAPPSISNRFTCDFEDIITYGIGTIPLSMFGIIQGEWSRAESVFGDGIEIIRVNDGQFVFPPFENRTNVLGTVATMRLISSSSFSPPLGLQQVRVRLKNQCGWSDWVNIIYSVGDRCTGGIFPWSIDLYQPTNNELHIEFLELSDTEQVETYTITLSDNFGNIHRRTQFRHRERDGRANPVRFNTSGLPPGVYHLHIEGAGQAMTKQVIVR